MQSPPSPLELALESYRLQFGHEVPGSVAAMFATRPGPLLFEIRQALALQRPVPRWRDDSRLRTEPANRWTQVG